MTAAMADSPCVFQFPDGMARTTSSVKQNILESSAEKGLLFTLSEANSPSEWGWGWSG